MSARPLVERVGHISLYMVLFDEKTQHKILNAAEEDCDRMIECSRTRGQEPTPTQPGSTRSAAPPHHPGLFYSNEPLVFSDPPEQIPPSLSLAGILATHHPTNQQWLSRDLTTYSELMPTVRAHFGRLRCGPHEFTSAAAYRTVLQHTVLTIMYLSTALQAHVKRGTTKNTAEMYFDTLGGGFVNRTETAFCGTVGADGKQESAALLPHEHVANEIALHDMCKP